MTSADIQHVTIADVVPTATPGALDVHIRAWAHPRDEGLALPAQDTVPTGQNLVEVALGSAA
jgi:hypothetical protein